MIYIKNLHYKDLSYIDNNNNKPRLAYQEYQSKLEEYNVKDYQECSGNFFASTLWHYIKNTLHG